MERGYLKLWRKSLDSEVFASEHLWILWTWCLMKASHKKRFVKFLSGKGSQSVSVLPGQFVFGRNKAAEVFGWSPSTVWNRLQKLAEKGCITIESNKQYSVVSVCNWGIYQADDEANMTSNEHATDMQLTSNGHAIDTNKNVKNEENVDNEENKKHSGVPPCPHLEIVSIYNEKLPALARVKEKLWNGARSKNLHSRWTEDQERQDIKWWAGLFDSIKEMPFLLGENDKGWKADLGWIVKKENMIKVLEGKYKSRKTANNYGAGKRIL